jgi:RNA polymerase sigma-70 factor (ECF subfamily)
MSSPTPARSPADDLADAFRRVRDDLCAYARRRLNDRALAEEAVQDTFLRAWRSIHRYDPDAGSERMWLFGICRNAITDITRRRTREPVTSHITDVDEVGDVAIEGVTEGSFARERADDALAAMTPAQRDAVMQVLWLERPYADAAATLGVPVGTVKSRVHHGLISARRAAA